ncbi:MULTISPECIES: Uma2 family endonuclease [unclassified Streptomyces]|uniref:Uma2 family endonuclease n=1 Tax=unclassified Streptomyces TaxID=2593676 RepID=UPI001E4D7DC9|nr:Uma2 family endonuclease [Streptomyces sp. MBT42]MCD2464851.1 Uma2 family endonuclease [Streptomyces sp. MBT42]
MSALTVDHSSYDHGWDDLVRIWEETDAPEGCKVEIIEGIITVSPSPASRHNSIASRVHRRLVLGIPEEWGVVQTLAIAVPARRGMFVPDLAVLPFAVLDGPGQYVAADAVELVAEVTSPSNANHDRISKAAGYAAAGIPLYLLIDAYAPGGPTVTLYGEPKGDVYRVLRAVPFGEEIHLPAPFDLALDTAEFPVS